MGVDAAAEEQFGPYLVYERLGIGGMATVHRALERGIEGFERIVALKRLLPHLAEDASFIKSFVREAKLASLLNHVNIVQIYELGRVGTEYFISMEFIDGKDIRRILRHARKVTGPPPIHVTVGLLLQLCDALDYAHTKTDEHGHPLELVHRDVSPSNLLITQAGHLKVIDFGIAKAQSSQLRTQTGRVKGKLAYMAPEAIAGKDLDARSDLFAAGVIAHELLTARPLFASKNEYQTLLKVQRGDIMPPSTFNQACPPELDGIVLKTLARDPDERIRDAGQLRDLLLELRRRYNLQTGHRDVAQWIDWAFSVEPPSGGFAATNTFDQTGSVVSGQSADLAFNVREAFNALGKRTPTPAPRPHREDDEAVEMAWGGGDPEEQGAPIVLDDVPDVSDKHLGGSVVVKADDLGDDIPPPQPSHGTISRPRLRENPKGSVPPLTMPRRPTQSNIAVAAASLPAAPPRGLLARTTGSNAVLTRPSSVDRTGGVEAQSARAISDLSAPLDEALDEQIEPETRPALPGLVRISEKTSPAIELPSLDGRLPSTRPGHEPARTPRGSTTMPVIENARASQRMQRADSVVSFGSSMIAARKPSRTWLAVGVLAAAAGAAGFAVYATSRSDRTPDKTDQPTKVPVQAVGTVKFVTEPGDAEISIEGKQVAKSSPWSTQLPAGIHQIQIQRTGYKAWLTSLELSANETQTLRVVLEPLGGSAAAAEATLILSSSPIGLDVTIDGQLQPLKTPLKMPLKPGAHVIALRQSGAEVWRHEIVAQAAVDYEFAPSMSEDKQRERAERVLTPKRQRTAEERARIAEEREARAAETAPGAVAELKQDKTVDKSADKPADKPVAPMPAPPVPSPVPAPPPTTPQVAQQVPPAPPPIPAPNPVVRPNSGAPAIVAPGLLRRIEGDTPTVYKSKTSNVPAVITAKVCIDAGGRVFSVDVLSKLERMTTSDLTKALRSWVYAPYKRPNDNVAVPVCFVVSFRSKS